MVGFRVRTVGNHCDPLAHSPPSGAKRKEVVGNGGANRENLAPKSVIGIFRARKKNGSWNWWHVLFIAAVNTTFHFFS
jgi:hypothetical protein